MATKMHGSKEKKKTEAKPKKSWMLKKGADAQAGMKKETEERDKEFNSLWRYYLRPEEEGSLTFLEGDLITEGPQAGMFDITYLREHRVSVPGSKVPKFYACVAEEEDCPLCATDNRSSYVGLFTVIDHRKTTGRDGTIYKDQKRIFAAKSGTLKRLVRKAKSEGCGGTLEGCTFQAARSDERSATVGDEFELLGQNSLKVIGKKLDPKDHVGAVATADWDEELNLLSADELRGMFHVESPSGPGYDGGKPSSGYDSHDDNDSLPPDDNDDEDDLPF